MTYHAKIRAKGLDNTGVTEELASKMYAAMGGTTLAIVELEHVERGDDAKGDHSVALTIGLCEPALTERMEDHLRELMRAMYLDRRAAEGDAIPGMDDGRRSLDDVLQAGSALVERDDDGDATGTWDGSTDDAPGSPMEEHPFVGGGEDPKRCALDGCGKTNRAAVHVSRKLAAVPDAAQPGADEDGFGGDAPDPDPDDPNAHTI